MVFSAECPFCHLILQKVPGHLAGSSVECRRCRNSFTLAVMPSAASLQGRGPRLGTQPKATSPVVAAAHTNPGGGAGSSASAEAPIPIASLRPSDTVETVLAPSGPADVDPSSTKPAPALVLALIAITLAGLSLVVSQVPFGRIGSVALAGPGLILGLVSLSAAAQKRLLPGLAAGLNAAVVLVAVAVPTWLGMSKWWPTSFADDSGTVKAVRHNSGGASAPAEWVEAGKESWRQGDVLVSVRSLVVEPVELTGPNGKTMRTKEPRLQIWLRITNEGVARKIEFTGWDGPGQSAAPRLTDSSGNVVPTVSFQPGWEPAGRPASAAVFPGKWAENLLVFAAPPAAAGELFLELPGSAFGSGETVRFLLPRTFFSADLKRKANAVAP